MTHIELKARAVLIIIIIAALALMSLGGINTLDAEQKRVELNQRVYEKMVMHTPEEINATIWEKVQ